MPTNLGQNWLLLRGLSREAGHWGDFIPQFQSVYPNAQINTLDLPGTGEFYQDHSPDNIPAITRMVREQALARGILAKPVTVLALSMGGMVAWEWLNKYPEDLAGGVLINSSFASLSPFYQRLRWQSYLKLIHIILAKDLYQRELAIIKLVSNMRDNDAKTALRWEEIQKLRPVTLRNCFKQILAAARYKPQGNKPEKPLLLINCRGDRLVAPACSLAMHKNWQIDLHTNEKSGHDLGLDDSIWLANQLKIWTDSQLTRII